MRLFPLSFLFSAPRQEQNNQVPFSIVEEKTKVTIKLHKPEAVYLKNKVNTEIREELISQISAFISLGRAVEINCGEVNSKTNYVMDELLSKEIINLIEKQDDQKIEAKKEQRLLKNSNRWFFSGRTNYGFVIYEKKETEGRAKIIDFNRLPKFADYVPQSNGNKYSKAPSLITDKSICLYMDQLDELLKENSIVQIRRRRLHGKPEELGMFVEKKPDTQEIIFNFNGQNEIHFDELFIPLALYFLERGYPVLVECDLDASEEDIERIKERISQGDIYDQAYKGILRKTRATIYVERRIIHPDINQESNFIVMKPNRTQET